MDMHHRQTKVESCSRTMEGVTESTEVDEVDAICVHVGGEEVEKQTRSCMVSSVFL